MLKTLKGLWLDEEAPTSVEYAIMIGGIAVVIIGAVWYFGGTLNNSFSNSANKVTNGP
jgi:pilus assembly protein Flp/PilA